MINLGAKKTPFFVIYNNYVKNNKVWWKVCALKSVPISAHSLELNLYSLTETVPIIFTTKNFKSDWRKYQFEIHMTKLKSFDFEGLKEMAGIWLNPSLFSYNMQSRDVIGSVDWIEWSGYHPQWSNI